jgi:uncharacterized protein
MKEYLRQTWNDPRINIRRSPISGNGMFVREMIRKGETVSVAGGVVMTEAEFEAFQASHSRYNAIQIDEDLHLVEQVEITKALEGSMNHSCDSNVWMLDEVTLVARRDIVPGEEITVDYGLFTAQSGWMLENSCHCASSHCRQTITGNDWKQEDVQERYLGHFSPFLNRRIANLRLQSMQ